MERESGKAWQDGRSEYQTVETAHPGCAERNADRYKQEQDGRILDGGPVGEEAARAVRFCAGSKSSITSEHTLEPYIRYSLLSFSYPNLNTTNIRQVRPNELHRVNSIPNLPR